MYSKQLDKGSAFERLREVYALALVNDDAFDYEGDDGYMQEFYITNKNHPDDIRKDLALIFVELPKYRPLDRGSRAIKKLWLRYLTEIDESTQSVDAALTDNPDINEALQIVERSAYSDGDLYKYNDYRLEIMTQRNAMMRERSEGFTEGEKKGLAEGRAEGLAEGERKAKLATVSKMLTKGFSIDEISEMTGLTPDEITSL